MTIGTTFATEMATAGIGGLPISWRADGTIEGRERLTAEQSATLDAVILAHNPTKRPYREQRSVAYRDELGVDKGDFVKTIGDVLDTLIAEIATLRAAQPTTAAFAAMITKIQAVKARFPKE